jgi:hypothetical protein
LPSLDRNAIGAFNSVEGRPYPKLRIRAGELLKKQETTDSMSGDRDADGRAYFP